MELASVFHKKPCIVSKRLVLRPLRVSDVSSMSTVLCDESLYIYSSTNTKSIETYPKLQFESEVNSLKKFHWGIQFEEKVVGELWLHLDEDNHSAKLAYRVAPLYQRKGIATESIRAVVSACFASSELKRIWADVFTCNVASIRVLEKSGFHQKELVRQIKDNCESSDYYIYEIQNSSN